jgi:hypothetical protein
VVELRSADGFGGLVILGVVFFVLNVISRAKKASNASRTGLAASRSGDMSAMQEEPVSLESILRQIETVKRQKEHGPGAARPAPSGRAAPRFTPKPAPPRQREVVQDDRGPLGRISRTGLQSAEDVEDRTSLEDEGQLVQERRLQNVEVFTDRPERVIQNRDEEAEAVVQRRIKSAEARNRPLDSADHASFDQSIRAPVNAAAGPPRLTVQGLRDAFVWREILGPPKSLQDE